MRNVILTGIPRAGTTLAGALIDDMPDTVCLNEPGWHNAKTANTAEGFAQWVAGDFERLRMCLLHGEPIPDRRGASGEAVTNYYAVDASKHMVNTFEIAPFTRAGLTNNFTLAIKHNGPYLAVLPQLVDMQRFTIIAIVRHPLEVLASWRRLSLPISRGQMPNATPFWSEMAEIVATEHDLLVRQVKMYDEMCRRIIALKDYIHILPYEKLVSEPQLLAEYIGTDANLTMSRVEKPTREIPDNEKKQILSALAMHGKYYQAFYTLPQ
ncbi:MAG: sulfotransferase [Alphaproteobacteria bacterium]